MDIPRPNKDDAERIAGMSGSEAWEAFYRDALCDGIPVDSTIQQRAFYAGINHAMRYIRLIQGDL
jgi:hypothetical protein